MKFKRIITILVAILIFYFGFMFAMKKYVYPYKYAEYVNKYSEEYELDPYLVLAVIKTESDFDKTAVSKKDAKGLMQIMETTAIETANKMGLEVTEKDLFEPELNINIGLKYFTYLLNQYNNNYPLAIIAYNAGIGNVDNWIKNGIIKEDGTDIENVPFKETNNYVRKILRDYKIYKELYD